jgi:5-methylcytosine-specific restriction endonuclease McrA
MPRKTNKNKSERKRLWREANGYTYNGNRLVQVLPFEEIATVYHEHHRLRVFAEKGYTCAICGRVGTKFLETAGRTGDMHRDLYTEDLVLMTIDHIIPKVKGGSEDMDNLRPCCSLCNWEKGRTTDVEGLEEYRASLRGKLPDESCC